MPPEWKPKDRKRLVAAPDGMFGTAAARHRALRMIRVISHRQYQALGIVRTMRNAVAHQVKEHELVKFSLSDRAPEVAWLLEYASDTPGGGSALAAEYLKHDATWTAANVEAAVRRERAAIDPDRAASVSVSPLDVEQHPAWKAGYYRRQFGVGVATLAHFLGEAEEWVLQGELIASGWASDNPQEPSSEARNND